MPDKAALTGVIPLIAPAIDSPAPLIYADFLAHLSVINGVMRLSFAQNLGEPTDAITSETRLGWHARYCATIAMPVGALPQLVEYLSHTVESYRAQGILPPLVTPDGN